MRLHHSWISPLNRSATLLLTASCLLAQTPAPATIARAAATELGEGRIAALHARFAEDLKVVLTEELLRDPLVKDLVAGAGAFQQTEAPSCKPTQTVHLCAVPLLYEHARIRLRIAVDSAGHVAGLFVDGREPR